MGYLLVGLIAGAFIGAWLVMQNSDYQRAQAEKDKREQDALFKKYLDFD